MAETRQKMANASSVFRLYWNHTKRYPVSLSIVLISTVLIQFGDLTTPWFLRQLFNVIARTGLATYDPLTLVVWVGLLSFGVWVLRRFLGFALMHFEGHIMRDLLDEGFSGLISHSYNFFISHFAGSLTHKVNKFSRAYETLFDAVVTQFVPTLIFVAGAVIILFLRHPTLGCVLAAWSIVFVGFQVYVARKRQALRVARSERETETTGAIADAIGNHATIQLFSGITYERKLLGTYIERWHAALVRAWQADEFVWAGLGLLMTGIEIGLLWIAVVLWQRGQLAVGDFVLIQAYLLTTFERLVAINRELRRFYDAYADASEMVALLEESRGVVDVPDATPLVVKSGAIAFRDMSFAFHADDPILQHFSLEIAPGERVALVGPSGAGKSTITKLLLRLYDLSGGAIEIDGQNIARVQQESLRNAIAFVPQEPILFHRSLLDNIRYGRRDANDAEVIEAAKKAHCHEFIDALPQKYETYVGERGVKLSGGERQRIAIARAILRNAPILILDEATSSLDSESEALIQDALATLMTKKSVLVIAHRLSTIMHMDRIVVVKSGQVVAMGTHAELLERGGLYQKLWNIQAGGFLTEEELAVEETAAESDDQDDDADKAPYQPRIK